MTAVGDMLYIFGGQVKSAAAQVPSLGFFKIWFQRDQHSTLTTDPRDVLQDPVTGSCYNDIIMMDSRSWQWMALEVHTWLSVYGCLHRPSCHCCSLQAWFQLMLQCADITRFCQHCRGTTPHFEHAGMRLQDGNTVFLHSTVIVRI